MSVFGGEDHSARHLRALWNSCALERRGQESPRTNRTPQQTEDLFPLLISNTSSTPMTQTDLTRRREACIVHNPLHKHCSLTHENTFIPLPTQMHSHRISASCTALLSCPLFCIARFLFSASMHMHVYACMCVGMSACVHTCMCMYVCVNVYVCVHACGCVRACIHL